MISPSSLCLLAFLGLLAACSRDARRENPLDPELTPAVELSAATLDTTSGRIALSWSAYSGQQPFAAYHIQRKVQGQASWTTLDTLQVPDITSWTDSTLIPDTDYEYRVAVANTSGHVEPSNSQAVSGYRLHSVRLLAVDSDPESGIIQLQWSRYTGPGFERYRVLRRRAGTDQQQEIAAFVEEDATAFADITPLADVNYLYHVEVVAKGIALTSELVEQTIELPTVDILELAFDSMAATATVAWSPYIGPRFASYVVQRASGAVVEKITQIDDVSQTSFADHGLLGNTEYTYRIIVHTERSESVASSPLGGKIYRFLGEWPLDLLEATSSASSQFMRLQFAGGAIHALHSRSNSGFFHTVFDREGHLLSTQTILDLSRDNVEIEARSSSFLLQPERTLFGTSGTGTTPGVMAVGVDGPTPGPTTRVQLQLSSEEHGEGPESFIEIEQANDRGVYRDITLFSGVDILYQRPGIGLGAFIRAGVDWENFGARLTTFYRGILGFSARIALGRRATGRAVLDLQLNEMQLSWERSEEAVLSPLVSVWPYIDIDPKEVEFYPTSQGYTATSQGAALWSEEIANEPVTWTSMANLDGTTLFTIDTRTYRITAADSIIRQTSDFPDAVAELRTWQVSQERSPRVGACMPDAGAIHMTSVFRADIWDRTPATVVGPVLRGTSTNLFYPLSLDGHTDGRVYVLDAGNARIVVLDQEGTYITQIGLPGDGAGEFDFLDGLRIADGLNFAGSLAVDDDGFIYVADVGNRRIQKFAP
jgi:hypothetical protein